MIYADHAATTPLDPAARAAMEPYLAEQFGNPSSLYRLGLAGRRAVELARRSIAQCLGCMPEEIYFTSGGSESNTWAVWHAARAALTGTNRGGVLAVSAIEHHSLLRACRSMEPLGCRTVLLRPDGQGILPLEEVERALDRRPALLSVQYANNEVGAIQPIREIAARCRARGVLFHTDAVQAVGHIPLSLAQVDLLSASAHKFGGPKGVGFLYARHGLRPAPLICGGGQEQGVRGGTEPVCAIVGMAAALEAACARREELAARLRRMEEEFRAVLRAGCPEAVFRGPEGAEKLPGLISVTLPGVRAEGMVYRMDMAGVCLSAGAACDQRGRREPSHVLTALGLPPEEAESTLRISFGPSNRSEDGAETARLLLSALRS